MRIRVIDSELIERTHGRRILSLDALRGVAAFVVICHHFRNAFLSTEPRWYLRPFFSGKAAITLFFVLSGYVLSIPYWDGRQPPYDHYIVRRIFRIYVPYAAAVIVAVSVGKHLLFSHLPLTDWFYLTWQTPMTSSVVGWQLLDMPISPAINTAFWSLRYEMQMSIVFPAVCWLMRRARPLGSVIGAIALQKLALFVQAHWFNPTLSDFCWTIIYGSCFVYGAVLAWRRDYLRVAYERSPRWSKIILLVAVVAGYFNTNSFFFVPFAACGVILFAQHSRANQLLQSHVTEYLGRISYSMYLMHGTVLFASLILLYGKVTIDLLFTAYVTVTFILSHTFCVLVEEPSIRLGKRLARKI